MANTLWAIDLYETRIKKVMKFSKDLFVDFIAQEKNEMEEWKQSYEGVEDAGM